MTRVVVWVLCCVMTSGTAWAAGPEDLGLGYQTAVRERAQPTLVLRPVAGIRRVVFTLTDRASGSVQTLTSGSIVAGATKKLVLKHGEGRTTYDGAIVVEWADGTSADYTVSFEAVRYHALTLDMTWEDVDLDHRVVRCRASHEVKSLSVVLEDASGVVIHREERAFDVPVPGGEELAITWPEPSRPAARLKLEVHDPEGVWASMLITPFTIEVPHDEVQFELGRADIPKSEIPKLDKTLASLRQAMKEHGSLLDLKLFIAGFTDTIGDPASNRALSLARAASISAWFRKSGVRLPIYYRGFGEEQLAVATPDETDEVRNRRALYILSVHPPLGVRVAQSGWEELRL